MPEIIDTPSYVGPERRKRPRGRPALVEGQTSEQVFGVVPPDVYVDANRIARARFDGNLSMLVRMAVIRFVAEELSQ